MLTENDKKSFENVVNQQKMFKILGSKNLSDKHKRNILKNADPALIKAISDCTYNLLNGNIKLSEKDKKKLSRFKISLRRLIKKKSSLQNRKKLLIRHANQKGGFLNILIPALIGGIATIIGSWISKPSTPAPAPAPATINNEAEPDNSG